MSNDRIERLGPYDVLGERVTIDTFEPLAGALRHALTDLAPAPDDTPARTLTVERFTDDSWSVSWPDEQRYDGPSAPMAFYDVLRSLDDAGAHRIAHDGGIGLHGGAVSIDGHGVALVGYSGAGKSTLTARLVLDGHGFVGDEIAAVSPDHRLLPFHRPIGLRPVSLDLLGVAAQNGPFDVSSPLIASEHTALAGPTPLTLIAFVDRTSDDTEPRTFAVTPAEALQRLCNQTLGTRGLERDVFHRLDRLVRAVPAIALSYADAADGAALAVQAVREAT